MKLENIRTEIESPGIAWVTISRPKALNALNGQTLEELKFELARLSNDPAVRVVVLTGDGEKAFIAGADISEMSQKTNHQGIAFARLGHEVTKLLELMPKPTIAAVNGFALGGGTEMAIACDFILASDNAQFGQPEVGLGILPRFVGWPMAKELIYSGRRISADEALRLGLTNHVFPKAEFRAKVSEIARSIALQSAGAVSRAKMLMTESSESAGLENKLDSEAHAFARIFGSHDQKEGMGAFLEKRKPSFEGLKEIS